MCADTCLCDIQYHRAAGDEWKAIPVTSRRKCWMVDGRRKKAERWPRPRSAAEQRPLHSSGTRSPPVSGSRQILIGFKGREETISVCCLPSGSFPEAYCSWQVTSIYGTEIVKKLFKQIISRNISTTKGHFSTTKELTDTFLLKTNDAKLLGGQDYFR